MPGWLAYLESPEGHHTRRPSGEGIGSCSHGAWFLIERGRRFFWVGGGWVEIIPYPGSVGGTV